MENRKVENLPTWVEVDLDAFIHNVQVIRSKIGRSVKVMLVVKADAYAHGAVQMTRAVADRVDYFGVATVEEAVELATSGLRKKLLIMTPLLTEEIATVVDRGFCATVASVDSARAMSELAARKAIRVEVHVEVDTGMGRAGVWPSDAWDLLDEIARLPGVHLGGMWTHFPDADGDRDFTRRQVNEFVAMAQRARKKGIDIPVLHGANSAAIATLPESHMDMVRPGLSGYGHRPGSGAGGLAVRPVASWKCRIVRLRDMPAGATVSYGGTYRTDRPTTMAVLPVGYGHGYPFRLSNCGEVIVAGRRVPIMGRVTMDMTMVDVTDVTPRPGLGDEVMLLGGAGESTITVDDIARWAGTISYEILTGISRRVPRLYIRGGKIEARRSILGASRESVV